RAIWTRVVGSRQQVDGHPRLVGAIQDITDERAALDALEASETRYRRLFHYSLGLICTHTLDGTLTSVNPAAVQSLGFEESQMIGRSLCDLMPPEKREGFKAYLARIQANHTDAGVIELIAADGTRHYWAYHNVLDSEASPPYVLGHAQDVTALRMQEQQLREMSFKDPLTQCYNRRYLHRLDELIDERWACVMFDLDHFKHINDTHGHEAGDDALRAVAAAVAAHARDQDLIARFGGEEFCLLVPGLDQEAALTYFERLRQAIAALEVNLGETTLRMTVSIGLCCLRPQHDSLHRLISEADRQLYLAKAGGRNRVNCTTVATSAGARACEPALAP
ncbi:MAG TPA: sensor domain-containing diguanylate cyclase, partial [Stenotrophomonas sp.]|nr:sensor domain-containing diguanylate cyclase [Stenotrophomonas sp.]